MRHRDSAGQRSGGVTLPELLVVLAIFALGMMVAMPIASDAVLSMRGRTAVRTLVVTLQAARFTAVKSARPVEVRIFPDAYEYRRSNGAISRETIPPGVRVVSAPSPVVFQPNGAVPGGATTLIEVDRRRGAPEVWAVETTAFGKTKATRRTSGGSS